MLWSRHPDDRWGIPSPTGSYMVVCFLTVVVGFICRSLKRGAWGIHDWQQLDLSNRTVNKPSR